MRNVAITGGIGSGKSVVCQIFSILGIPVYNADMHAKKLMDNDRDIQQKLITTFGHDILLGMHIDKKKLASLVFGNEQMLQRLNAIMHPAVFDDYKKWGQSQRDAAFTVFESALIFETNSRHMFYSVVLVYAPSELCVQRVCVRDGVKSDEVLKRMRHQWNPDDTKQWADHVIYNDEKRLLIPQVLALYRLFVGVNGE